MTDRQPTLERPLRADAERNRRRILAAAAELFGERGLEVSLDDIAAHAGVGVGTVYRRFADKDELIDKLFAERIELVADAAGRALERDEPWDALIDFMGEASALFAADRGLKEVMLRSRGRGRERCARARDLITPRVAVLVQRARDDGELRDDFDAHDVPIVELMLSVVIDATSTVAPQTWERFLGIVIDGMRHRRNGPTPLAAGPLDAEQLTDVMSRRS